ncbi:AMP-binding protein [Accumulibacter sp.]|uniref:AMP-binding enzyme n=1 Tax=Accumulibacter sp. TaxID=2053492 RepID=UPI0025826EFB|nr:AMP-binding protein [Accumulibacter sp.]
MMQRVADPGTIYDLDLRTLASVGEPVDPALWHWARDKMGVAINGIFGPAGLPDLVGNWASLWPASPGAVGRAYPGHRVAVIDAQGNALPPGEVGELAVFRQYHAEDDPLPMLGYWRDRGGGRGPSSAMAGCVPANRRRSMVRVIYSASGPADDTFASAGYRVDPSEIETCLRAHAVVANCAVIGRADELGGTRPRAFVVLRPGVLGTPELVRELQRHVGRYLAPYETPKAIEFTAALPLGASGGLAGRLEHSRNATDGMYRGGMKGGNERTA